MMKNILLPTDFSENSWNAIKYALQFFKEDVCAFYMLNTYTPIILNFEQAMMNSSQYELADALRETSLNNLKKFKKKIQNEFQNDNHTIKSISSFNVLISEIKEVIKDKNINYIVMGTKGATGAKEVLFGSNTVQVFKHVRCPVLAIPNDFEYESPHDILFPTDYDISYQPNHLKPIVEIANTHISRVNILHVFTNGSLSKTQEKNKALLESNLQGVTHLYHDVERQNVMQAIDNFQIKTKINLLIMINNKHSFFENLFFRSTLNRIGFHLKIPFLVIPSTVKQLKSKV